jgi:hypothetical protein
MTYQHQTENTQVVDVPGVELMEQKGHDIEVSEAGSVQDGHKDEEGCMGEYAWAEGG